MSIKVTPAAAQHIDNVIKKRGSGLGFRLAVKDTGCSGYSYVMGIADEVGDQELVFQAEGVQIIVPKDSVNYLQGTEIDLAVSGLNRKLVFHNPNAVDACGCGESFNLKEGAA
ncbi:MAG: iron-sulfur cluster assembly accessory protein [Gammaproteobacteria bacterium]|jgi:iron-sulfur cluster assembly protein